MKEKTKRQYPEYVEVAINWWLSVAQFPEMYSNPNLFETFNESVESFKRLLAERIIRDVNGYRRIEIVANGTYLEAPSRSAFILGCFPRKARMTITKDEVKVTNIYTGNWIVLWRA